MSQFARLTTTALLSFLLASFTVAQTIDELRRDAEGAKARREQLEKSLNPALEPPNTVPAQPQVPRVIPLGENTAWLPYYWDSYSIVWQDDGTHANDRPTYTSELFISDVSSDQKQFTGYHTYKGVWRNGRYHGGVETAIAHVRIDGQTITLRHDAQENNPWSTVTCKGSINHKVRETGKIIHGVDPNDKVYGTWKSRHGGSGTFSFSPPRTSATAIEFVRRLRELRYERSGYIYRDGRY